MFLLQSHDLVLVTVGSLSPVLKTWRQEEVFRFYGTFTRTLLGTGKMIPVSAHRSPVSLRTSCCPRLSENIKCSPCAMAATTVNKYRVAVTSNL